MGEKMKLYFTRDAWDRYVTYCQEALPNEISGLGEVELMDGKLVVTKLHVIKQEVSPTASDFDDEAQAKWFVDFCAKGGKPEKLRLWWHTHPGMGVEFSGKDRDTIKGHMQSADWFIATIINEKGKRKGAYFQNRPVPMPDVVFEETDFMILKTPEMVEEIRKEIKEKCIVKTVKVVSTPVQYHGRLGHRAFTGGYGGKYGFGMYGEKDDYLTEEEYFATGGITDVKGRVVNNLMEDIYGSPKAPGPVRPKKK